MYNEKLANINELRKENELLYSYLHDYQKELSKYADRLSDIDKCSERNLFFENLELKKQLDKNAYTMETLWKCFDWLDEYASLENNRFYKNLLKKLLWFVLPSYILQYRALKNNNFKKILSWHAKHGIKKTQALLSSLPINLALRAKAWSEIAKSQVKKNPAEAEKLAFAAWRVQPKAYRLKFLAFRIYENGNPVLAIRIIDSLPSCLPFSESENRYARQIRNKARDAEMEDENRQPSSLPGDCNGAG